MLAWLVDNIALWNLGLWLCWNCLHQAVTQNWTQQTDGVSPSCQGVVLSVDLGKPSWMPWHVVSQKLCFALICLYLTKILSQDVKINWTIFLSSQFLVRLCCKLTEKLYFNKIMYWTIRLYLVHIRTASIKIDYL